MKKLFEDYRVLRNVIFFFDVFLAFLLILASFYLPNDLFSRAVLSFGIVMLALSTLMKVFRMW